MYYQRPEDFLRDLENHMRQKGLSEGAIRIYLGRIRALLEREYSVNDLCGICQRLWEDLGPKGQRYDAADHGYTRAAVGHVRDMLISRMIEELGDFCISYDYGWSSFRPKGKYLNSYRIENGEICFEKSTFFTPGTPETRKISDKDLYALIILLKEAMAIGCLASSDTCPVTVHGKLSHYDYEIWGKEGHNCFFIFDGESPYVKKLSEEYHALIKKITK